VIYVVSLIAVEKGRKANEGGSKKCRSTVIAGSSNTSGIRPSRRSSQGTSCRLLPRPPSLQ
jgi:hypothetical protein